MFKINLKSNENEFEYLIMISIIFSCMWSIEHKFRFSNKFEGKIANLVRNVFFFKKKF